MLERDLMSQMTSFPSPATVEMVLTLSLAPLWILSSDICREFSINWIFDTNSTETYLVLMRGVKLCGQI